MRKLTIYAYPGPGDKTVIMVADPEPLPVTVAAHVVNERKKLSDKVKLGTKKVLQ